MKFGHLFMTVIIICAILFSCEKKVSQKEYLDTAQEYMVQQNWGKAAEHFEKAYQEYPDGLFSSKALFMIGYIYANHLNDHGKARKYYQTFVDKFPDHELVNDAKYELEHMGKNADELPFLNQGGSQGASETPATSAN